MKHLIFGSAALLALAAAADPAAAADMPVKAPVYKQAAPLFDWTGFYAGGHCGGAWARSQSSGDPLPGDIGAFDTNVGVSYSDRASGWMCGVQYGRNWQQGNLVYGLEGDLGWLGVKKSAIHVSPPADDDTDFTSVKYRWYGTTTVRIGIAQNTSLFYLKGGLANARIENTGADIDDVVDVDPTDIVSVKKLRWGWTLGGGYEYAFAPQWSIKTEYLYMDFGKYTVNHFDPDGGVDTFRFRNSAHTVKVGLNYRFGDLWGKGPVAGKGPVVSRY